MSTTLTKVSVQTYCNALQHTATHCNTRQHTAIHCTLQHTTTHYMIQSCVRSRCGKQCVAVCCSVLLCTVTTLCCNALQCVAVCCSDNDDESEPSLLALALARALFLSLSLSFVEEDDVSSAASNEDNEDDDQSQHARACSLSILRARLLSLAPPSLLFNDTIISFKSYPSIKTQILKKKARKDSRLAI